MRALAPVWMVLLCLTLSSINSRAQTNVGLYLQYVDSCIMRDELSVALQILDKCETDCDISNMTLEERVALLSRKGLVLTSLEKYSQAHETYCLAMNLLTEHGQYDKWYVDISSKAAWTCYSADAADLAWTYINAAEYVYLNLVSKEDQCLKITLNLLYMHSVICDLRGDQESAIEGLEYIVNNYSDDIDVHWQWNTAAGSLAGIRMKRGEYDKAIKLMERIKPTSPQNECSLLYDKAKSYFCVNDERCINALENYMIAESQLCLAAFFSLPEADREEYWRTHANRMFDMCNTFAYKYPQTITDAYDVAIWAKTISLLESDYIHNCLRDHEDLANEFKQIKLLKNNLIYNGHLYKDSVAIWQDEIEKRQHHFMNRLWNDRAVMNVFLREIPYWTDVKKSLDDDDVAVEFITVFKIDIDNKIYRSFAALVLTSDMSRPDFVELCDYEVLESYINEAYYDEVTLSQAYQRIGTEGLYNKIWNNLAPYLKDKRKVFYAPTDRLNTINHNAIIDNEGRLLGDKYELIRLLSTSRISLYKTRKTGRFSGIMLYGGIDYEESTSSLFTDNFRKSERGTFGFLKNSMREVESIDSLFQSSGLSRTILTGTMATEESMRILDGKSPSILHFATHGFYVTDTVLVRQNKYLSRLGGATDNERKMTRTGLLLAGANKKWTGQNVQNGNIDGILTADEISRYDLSKTQLAVLSACNTGRGDADGIEGVIGLQGAFKKAGVETIVMSLWSVNDVVTAKLMTLFYKHLLQEYDVRKSLWEAQCEIRSVPEFSDPYYWAAFVVLE